MEDHLDFKGSFLVLIVTMSVFPPAKIEGTGEKHILGGASVHIKDFGSTPIPLQRQINTEGIGGTYPLSPYPLSMLGRTVYMYMYEHTTTRWGGRTCAFYNYYAWQNY